MQHVTGSDFKGALAWLADRFGPGAAAADLTARLRAQAVSDVKAAVAEREPFTPPQPAPEHWQHVREHLTKARALPGGYIDRLHELGDLYADAKRNAVFVCRDPETNRITGAEIKGTLPRPDGSRFTGMAPGSRKDGGGFRVGDIARAATVYLVESAIDAISLFQAAAGCRRTGPRSRFDRWNHPPNPGRGLPLADTARRVCADNDKAGDEAAHKLRRHKFERLKPSGKDWNDDLKAARDQSQAGGRETPPQAHEPETDNTPPLLTPNLSFRVDWRVRWPRGHRGA